MITRFKNLFWRYIASPIKYARHLGVRIGDDCLIATRYWGSEPYLITIGNSVQVTENVYFHTHGGAHVARTTYPDFDVFGKIRIEDGAYIGSGSHIMPGVTIGENSLVAAGSIVTKSVPPNTVVGGNPAKVLCSTEDYIKRNIGFNLNSKSLSFEDKKRLLLSLPEASFIRK